MDKCAKCGKTVYPVEKVWAIGQNFHKACFKCTGCNATLALGKELAHDGRPYCKQCHQGSFGPAGYGFGGSIDSHKRDTDIHSAPAASTPAAAPKPAAPAPAPAPKPAAAPAPPAAPAPAKTAKFCSECGKPLTGGKFCSECGAKVIGV
eukprot:TRINITY_DN27721_c0_g1_i1.p3 TRINITY_DN27721_c0_g1~~TRINITY_DN27721_c0_g1_i1.p3  ORF type:complete len:149 (+),score=30.97 TRINITY_DN27721_c0_g1_i1:76-522(+)